MKQQEQSLPLQIEEKNESLTKDKESLTQEHQEDDAKVPDPAFMTDLMSVPTDDDPNREELETISAPKALAPTNLKVEKETQDYKESIKTQLISSRSARPSSSDQQV